MFPKQSLRISIFTAAILSALWPVDGANAAGRDLVIGVTTLSKALDPMGANSNVNERISNNLIETLLRIDPKTGAIGPGLAESWTLESDGALTLKIREGIQCHNGEEFNAEDVEYMFGPARYMGKEAPGNALAKQFLGPISAVKAVDSHTVRVEVEKPDPLLEIRLASWMSQIPCADAFKSAESWEKWGLNVVGTGPYQLVEFKPGEYQKFKRFDGYWGDKAPADTLTFKVVPELAARIAGLMTGEYDIISEVTPDQIDAINGEPDAEVVGGAILNIRVILFDTRNPVLKDKRVRQALAAAIDRQLIVNSLVWRQDEGAPGHADGCVRRHVRLRAQGRRLRSREGQGIAAGSRLQGRADLLPLPPGLLHGGSFHRPGAGGHVERSRRQHPA